MSSLPRFRKRATALAVILVATACSGPTEAERASFSFATSAQGLVLHNLEGHPRWYLVVDAEAFWLIDVRYDPAEADSWTRIQPRDSALVPWERMIMQPPGARRFRVLSWRDVHQVEVEGEGLQWQPVDLREATIELP